MSRAGARCVAVIAVTLAAQACADKPLSPSFRRGEAVQLQLTTPVAMQNAPTARTIDVRIGYDRTSGERMALGSASVPVAEGSQQIAIVLDLAACVADENRAGSRSSCPLRIAIALRDTSATALDSLELGPLDAAPGTAPIMAPVDLAIQRFAVRQWVTDPVLQLGGRLGLNLNLTGLYGLVTGPGAPTLYRLGSGGTPGGALVTLTNGRWSATPFGFPGVSFQQMALLNPLEGWIVASGNGAGLYKYNGSGLTKVTGITDPLTAVSARYFGANLQVIAVGNGGVIWRGDGVTWTRDSIAATLPLTHVCITDVDEVFVLSNNAQSGSRAWRWDGTQWVMNFFSTVDVLRQLRCVGRGEAFMRIARAPSDYDFIAWNGSDWSTIPETGVPATSPLTDWAVVSPTEMYGWGIDANWVRHAFRFNGATWTELPPSTFGQGAEGIWADPRGGDAYFIAGAFESRLDRYNVAQRTTLAHSPEAHDAFMSSPTNALIVGSNTFRARWDGTRWSVDPPPPNTTVIRSLRGAWTDGPSNAWAVGNKSTIFRWNGTAWSVVSDTLNQIAGLDDYNGVWGSGSTVYVVGNTVLRCTSPSVCATESAPGSGTLYGVWGSSADNVFAVGNGGRILRRTGTTWLEMPSPTTRRLVRIWGSSATDVWAVGDSTLVHFDGTAWTSVPMTGALAEVRTGVGQSAPFNIGIWGSSPNDVYVGGPQGRIVRFDGRVWTQMSTTTVVPKVVAIMGAAGFGAVAVTAQTHLVRGIGATGGLAAAFQGPVVWP